MKSATILLMKFTLSFLFIICIISNQQINAQPYISEDMSMFLSYGRLNDFKYSPNGKILATFGSAGLLFWDIENHKLINNIVDTSFWYTSKFVWFSDNNRIAISTIENNIKIINIYTGELLDNIETDAIHIPPQFDLNIEGTKILTWYRDTIVVIDVKNKGKILKFYNKELRYEFGIWSPDGKKIAFTRINSDPIFKEYIEIYDMENRNGITSKEFKNQLINSLTWNPDNKVIITSYNDTIISLWDAENGNLIQDLFFHNDINYINFSPDGKYLACASYTSKNIEIYNTDSWSFNKILCNDYYDCATIWNIEGKLLTYYNGVNILIKDISTSKIIDRFNNYLNCRSVVKWSPDGLKILSNSVELFCGDELKLWNAQNGELIRENSPFYLMYDIAWSPNGSMIACGDAWINGSGYGMIYILDTLLNKLFFRDDCYVSQIYSMDWKPDGIIIADAGEFGIYGERNKYYITIRTAVQPDDFIGINAHDNKIKIVDWSPDGSKLASFDFDGNIKIWDGNNLNKLNEFTSFYVNNSINQITWSNDSKYLAAYKDNTIIILDAVEGTEYKVIKLGFHYNEISSISWCPNGKIFALAINSGDIYLLETQNWSIVKIIHGYQNGITSLSWSPDSKKLVSSDFGGCIIIWEPKFTLVEDKSVSSNIVFNISPNPISSSIKIDYNVPYFSFIKISVFNIFGNEVKTIVNEFQDEGNKIIESNVNSLLDGVYFIKLMTGAQHTVEKFIKLK
ncbi:MAG: T9SS type A sorting domain-containing protein [Bacteroidetes bacterium]|nr:MAG: T9SS type A sorting domain-containing protein [Bacteroidota bacterium]